MTKIGNIEIGNFPLFLSPMENITDTVFRKICKMHGADVLITEFIASEALIREVDKSIDKMKFTPEERPIGIQIFGNEETAMCGAAQLAEQMDPGFIDINWGCPVRKIAGKGSGSGILKDIPKMIRITEAIVKSVNKPVTVKTRIGYEEKDKPIVEVAERLQDIGIAAISIHGRTKVQMYKGAADWTLIGEVKNNPRMQIPVFGNGDITSPEKALDAKNKYGVDGILIGRGAIGNPWIFNQTKEFLEKGSYSNPSVQERAEVCRRHLLDSIPYKGEKSAIMEMRQHYASYFSGLPNFKPFRIKLVTSLSLEEILGALDEITLNYKEILRGC